MIMRRLVALILVVIIVASVLVTTELFGALSRQKMIFQQSGFHVGVSFGGNTTAQAKLLIDKVKTYTNLLVVQSGPVSVNETSLNEIVDYAVGSGLDVIVFFGFFNPTYPWQIPWLDYAKQTWGTHFLGIYLFDEPGGQVIDQNQTAAFNQLRTTYPSAYYEHQIGINLTLNGTLPINNTDAATHFLSILKAELGLNQLENRSIHSFTSDYALYWFDYQAGYDTIFAELGSNQSTTQTIALARGAATLQNKTWGTILTWTYNQPPYLVNGTEMYKQLTESYVAGAKYVAIFDYPQIPGNPYGILSDEHFEALQKFWNNIPTLQVKSKAEAAFVMPHDFGWGMRSLQDKIWGIWAPDSASLQIWNDKEKLLAQYGTRLDIVYDDAQFPIEGKMYQHVYFWNQSA
jgi:hypothetical protein